MGELNHIGYAELQFTGIDQRQVVGRVGQFLRAHLEWRRLRYRRRQRPANLAGAATSGGTERRNLRRR